MPVAATRGRHPRRAQSFIPEAGRDGAVVPGPPFSACTRASPLVSRGSLGAQVGEGAGEPAAAGTRAGTWLAGEARPLSICTRGFGPRLVLAAVMHPSQVSGVSRRSLGNGLCQREGRWSGRPSLGPVGGGGKAGQGGGGSWGANPLCAQHALSLSTSLAT